MKIQLLLFQSISVTKHGVGHSGSLVSAILSRMKGSHPAVSTAHTSPLVSGSVGAQPPAPKCLAADEWIVAEGDTWGPKGVSESREPSGCLRLRKDSTAQNRKGSRRWPRIQAAAPTVMLRPEGGTTVGVPRERSSGLRYSVVLYGCPGSANIWFVNLFWFHNFLETIIVRVKIWVLNYFKWNI